MNTDVLVPEWIAVLLAGTAVSTIGSLIGLLIISLRNSRDGINLLKLDIVRLCGKIDQVISVHGQDKDLCEMQHQENIVRFTHLADDVLHIRSIINGRKGNDKNAL